MSLLKIELVSPLNPYWIGIKYFLLASVFAYLIWSMMAVASGYFWYAPDFFIASMLVVCMILATGLSSLMLKQMLKQTLSNIKDSRKFLIASCAVPFFLTLYVIFIDYYEYEDLLSAFLDIFPFLTYAVMTNILVAHFRSLQSS